MSILHPLLSVIVPFYNNEEFIIPCLTSLFDQIDNNIEVILINDGSTDNSLQLVNDFVDKKPQFNVKIISQNNNGISYTRNVGLENAQGRYITFLDGDDILSQDYMNVITPYLHSEEFDLIDFNYQRFVSEPGCINVLGKKSCIAYNFEQKGLYCLETLFSKSMWHLWNRIYKRTLLENEKFEIGRRYEDVIFTPFLYLKTKKIAHIDQVLYFYRDNTSGITRNIKKQDISDMLFAMEKMIDFANSHPEKKELKDLAAKMVSNCFGEVKSMSKAVYGYYYYEKNTLKVMKQAALLCKNTSVPGKKICQMRYPLIDTFLSKVRLGIKGRDSDQSSC